MKRDNKFNKNRNQLSEMDVDYLGAELYESGLTYNGCN